MEGGKLVESAEFLKAVICLIAEKKFIEDFVESDSIYSIGPGERWESKEEWMSDTISHWFNKTAEKIKVFPEGDNKEIKVRKMSVDLARVMYKLPLGESMSIDDDFRIVKVPGGWIYIIDTIGSDQSTVFVPYNDEFLEMSNLGQSDILKM